MDVSTITQSYFEDYAGRKLPYSKVWKEHSYYDECCKLFKRKNAPKIKSLCVLGAATGLVLREFHRELGLKASGCEINPWAYSQIPPTFRCKIACQDMNHYVADLIEAEKRFDLTFANSLIYLNMRNLKPFLKKLSRVTIYLHFQSSFKGNYCPDPFRRILKPYKWWNEVLLDSGFERYIDGRARTYCWKSLK